MTCEVQDADVVIGTDHDVGWLQVTVYDACGMGMGQGACDLPEHRDDVRQRQWASGQPLADRRARAIGERDEWHRFPFADLIDRSDVRVIERSGDARFAHQPADGGIILGGGRGEKLQRDHSLQFQVLGEVDDTKAPGAEWRLDDEVADSGT